MASARDRKEDPCEDGGGFGKFRKRPFRRAPTTPYDRPAAAIRHAAHGGTRNSNNGWLSRLVDPAQRLITSGAHRLFASVFRKRLPAPPPPPRPLEPEANQGATNRQHGAVVADQPVMRAAAVSGHDIPSTSDRGGISELELILRQKTFTRSEIEQLTTLLRSKAADQPFQNERNSEDIPSNAVAPHGNKEELQNTLVRDNGIENRFVSTPIVSSSVLHEDAASPAELAKSYMGRRPSKVSPSMLGLRNQPEREDPTALINPALPFKSPSMSVVPRSLGRAALPENGFVTPRFRGRSAIYNLSRTSYSRPSATVQGAGSTIDAFGGSSSSFQSVLENRFSGSKQGALKRRSSVLDNVGSVGPIRRIRQKSNLLPASLSIHGTDSHPDDVQHPSLTKKPALSGEPSAENGDNGVHRSGFTTVPSKSSEMASKILQQLDVLVSSREKSPTKLSPSMLRGPALRSLENIDAKILENPQDNSKLDLEHDISLLDARDAVVSQEQGKAEENGSMKHIVPYDLSASAVNGVAPTRIVKNNLSDVQTPTLSLMNSAAQPQKEKKWAFQMSAQEDYLELDDDDSSKEVVTTGSAEGREKQDTTLSENKSSAVDVSTVEKLPVFPQVKPPSSSILNQKIPGTSDGPMADGKSSGLLFPAAPFPSTTVQQAVVDDQSNITPDNSASPKEPSAAPLLLRFGDNVLSKESNGGFPASSSSFPPFTFASSSTAANESSGPKPESSSSLGFVSASADKVMRKDFNSEQTDNDSSKAVVILRTPNAESSTVSSSSPASSLFSFGTTTNNSSLNNGSLSSTPSPFSLPTLLLSGSPAQSSASSSSAAQSSASSSSALANNATSATDITTSLYASCSSSFSLSSSAPSFGTASVFEFGSSVVPSTSDPTLSPTVVGESTEAKARETSFGSITTAPFGSIIAAPVGGKSSTNTTGSSLFGVTSSASVSAGSALFAGTSAISSAGNSIFGSTSAAASTGGSSFGDTSAAASTGSNNFSFSSEATTAVAAAQSQGYNPFTAGSTAASAAGTSIATSTQSLPIQFGSSPAASFGSTVNTVLSSGGSPFSSASTPKLFSSGATFGLTASSSATEANSVGSSSSTSTTVFGSSWQTPKSPLFGSAFNSSSSSTGFAFGASSTSNAVTSSTSMVFGSSTSAQSGSIFSFSTPAATTSQPMFGSSNTSFSFGSSPTNNNDQMSMEDTMAEDTVQATAPSVPAFGQQAIAAPPSGFVFGSTAPSVGNPFGSTAPAVGNPFASTTSSGGNQFGSTPSGANPFQFGSQPNMAVPQTTSPFQASGSLEFNAGGSFSLGSGGGDKSNRKYVKVRKNSRKR